ncbi:bifunctional 4-hydroxy-2-oxoglutarate aldolase/2-dehydro-3-deoxy-phosphogluconate aldolase [Streptomyces ipomoeae]|uniref:Bifunctional 4-hydroxy-2-oxoglutarate aldolase/2-dehydro-3-deoxy-phosphogluconate aldolase n=1 Tax=Streptomyces ipomoeae TaxID=103232 RepID=A0AAE8W477_9ACTN|nr:bifunctional 4-hydroxy-2-oxoglutarate aldolase/2-dehydro-3-deoxy-phosphogluconate aldolase [Streptomyces ipomoeae]MDX2822013.1 bifunctional 4-hydroxy-2-oxoglutarate aldolase/2-dehydro-3-deoxy-phosphogluconate aldolase [Streptomyces ipomoeae]MDX2877190.1 bifunctional 4-hydroxy-2-oxoglutarate aldolase/2-dehydro-3-deoxy-phosphogluconate aldolase [Streptomyces ipomoeae]TQE20927.1 bifunctional 4-hydroxy-2-oxoglutarate aldolase/2-dehydro-3-deoxy-phosphogluconate aldolase [Streptomyces ipomoeae]TQE
MTERPALTPQLDRTRVMAILRSADATGLPAVARALADGGVTCLEITLTTSGALDALAAIRDELGPEVAVGAGTVITTDEARDALAAGAEFLVAPVVDTEVIRAAAARGIPCYPGAWTPTEVSTAWRAGAAAVKLFPASTGGPAHLRQLRAPLPQVPLVAVGGVGIDQARDYLDAGAYALGIGSPLLRGADRNPAPENLDALTARARTLLDAIRATPRGQEVGP